MAHCVQQARSLEEVKGASFVIFFFYDSRIYYICCGKFIEMTMMIDEIRADDAN